MEIPAPVSAAVSHQLFGNDTLPPYGPDPGSFGCDTDVYRFGNPTVDESFFIPCPLVFNDKCLICLSLGMPRGEGRFVSESQNLNHRGACLKEPPWTNRRGCRTQARLQAPEPTQVELRPTNLQQISRGTRE